MKKNHHISTKAIHSGNHPDKETGAVVAPIYQTSTYSQSAPGKHQGFEYSRGHNPTRDRLQECLASIENSKYCLTTSSGMSAAMLVMHYMKKDSKILCFNDLYGGSFRLFTNVFHERHQFFFEDASNTKDFIQKIKEIKPKLIWLESMTNPMLKIADIPKIIAEAKKIKALVLVDNTFTSPALFNPMDLGADIVLHSTTKYINGHSDVVGGALMFSSKKMYEKLFYLQNAIGPSPAPFDTWLTLRGVKTLDLRMKEHSKNALKVAKYLEAHPKVEGVIYPGLKNHPQYKLAKKLFSFSGGMISFYLKGNLKTCEKFFKKIKVFNLAESLGAVESLANHPAVMTHASIPKEIRSELGITDNLIRLSVGIESIDDLLEDLEQALK